MVVIIFDLETSGLNPYHDDIIEIGAKVLNSDNSFQTLVKPKSNRPVSKKISDITSITNRMLRAEGRQWLSAYSEFYNWLFENYKIENKLVIVSHNGLAFDFIFLKRILRDLIDNGTDCSEFDINNIYFHDTLLITRRLMPGRERYTQYTLARSFNIEVIDAHRAMGDVLVLEQIYPKLIELLSKNIEKDCINNPNIVSDYIDLKI